MSERKVLSKYYPPDFDPAAIQRTRGPKQVGPKVQTVRLMAPFSMKCTSCGEFVYRGRKFNARKETTDEKYYSIAIYRFYIRCTRCGGEITFKTDPKNMDYTCEKGAKRNFEPWRDASGGKEESEEERLDRLEREEEERNAMVELETKTLDAKREMQIADALDEIRTRNARNERADKGGAVAGVKDEIDEERERIEREDEEIARRAFMTEAGEKVRGLGEDKDGDGLGDGLTASSAPAAEDRAGAMLPPPTFKRVVKKKRDFTSALGIKKKPALV
ncbi:MAG: mrna splicing yju2 [Lasallia pustulata]|uniref:Splicing factor YJU2 n=1 Tax=Lasallia pustulata TaxID=136370 RepID=A0A5M8PBA5_9LECA|nr:MAG: mrna splicing yju2 [Lasallia pustulata]